MKWAILGCGQMSSALVLGALDGEERSERTEQFFCFDPVMKNAAALGEKIGDGHFHSLGDLPKCDIYLLSCKPQHFPELAGYLKNKLPKEATLLSVMAGVAIDKIHEMLECDNQVMRLMPNRGALVGHGVHALYHTTEVDGEVVSAVANFLNASGEVFLFDSEEMVDRITGVSGSGPAYLFKLAELMAEHLAGAGISHRTSHLMVAQTMMGAATMLTQNPYDAVELRESITSKGGVTQAALETLEQGGFDQLINQALEAAYERTQEL